VQEWLIVIMDDIRNHDCNHECMPDAYVCSCAHCARAAGRGAMPVALSL